MRRCLLLPLMAAAFGLINSSQLMAQTAAWPAYRLQNGWSGPGGYLNWVKILACWLIFLAWCGTTDWVSRDSQEHRTNYLRWNPILFGSFAGAMFLHWMLPSFWVGFPLLVIAYVGPLATYVVLRNRKVADDERSLHSRPPAVLVLRTRQARGREDRRGKEGPQGGRTPGRPQRQGRHRARRQHPPALRAAVARLHQRPDAPGRRPLPPRRGDHARIHAARRGREAHDRRHVARGPPRDRELGDPLLVAIKLLCGLNPEDRQGRQEGRFAVQFAADKYSATLLTLGTPAGERVLVQLEGKKVRFENMEALGMRPKMEEQIREIMARQQGFFLISAMPGSGLRSTTNVILRSSDRFMREFYALEDADNRYEAVENVKVSTYKAAEGQSPASALPELFFQDPNVIVVRDLVDGETVSLLCGEIPKDRLIVSTIRAKDSAEALLRVLALKAPPADFARAISAVLNQRLIRKLCPRCKSAYPPPPDVLQKLGIPVGKVEAFYRPPQAPVEGEKREVCPACADVGYVGRTAIFELLLVDNTVRKTLAATPRLDLLRQAARKAGMRSLQEEGIVLVAKGVTSLAELMRVLKQ